MCRMQVVASGPQVTVDRSWQRHWLADLQDEKMRNRIFNDPRFAGRVVDGILAAVFDHCDPLIDDFADRHLLAWLLSADRSEFLRRAGILWFAPSLADALLDPRARATIGLTDRKDLKAVFQYRQHTPAEIVGPVPQDVDYLAEGRACCLAWLAGLPRAVADRARLHWPVSERGDNHADHRRAFFRMLLTTEAGPVT